MCGIAPTMDSAHDATSAAESLEREYPSIDAAQGFVLPPYQWMLTRIEAVDSRIQALLTFVSTVTLALPAAGRTAGATQSFGSAWFASAALLAAATVVLGVVARGKGGVMLADPLSYYNTSLHLSKSEFQRDALFFSGKHFAKNKETVEAKHRALSWMTWLFVAELTCLFVWAMRA